MKKPLTYAVVLYKDIYLRVYGYNHEGKLVYSSLSFHDDLPDSMSSVFDTIELALEGLQRSNGDWDILHKE